MFVRVGDAVGVLVRVNVDVPAGVGVRVLVGVICGVGVHRYGYSSKQSILKSNVIASFVPFCICIFCIICNTVFSGYVSDDHVGCVKSANGITICVQDDGGTNWNSYIAQSVCIVSPAPLGTSVILYIVVPLPLA